METKELKVQVPEGYEIDKENSTFKCIKFKLIKKNITYEEVCKNIFSKDKTGFFITSDGVIDGGGVIADYTVADKNNATNSKQLKRILALNQLFNIAEYYNSRNRIVKSSNMYIICYNGFADEYQVCVHISNVIFGVEACFNNREDAQAVIDNPNFREILDTIYKD